MTILETILSLATLLLGGGCVTMFATLKSTRAKASEDVKAARIDNAEELLRLNQQFIVEPITTKIITLERTIKKLERVYPRSLHLKNNH